MKRYPVSKKYYTINSIVDETHNMKSFILSPSDGAPLFDYRPGHFINCTIKGQEDIGKRSYSIATSPTEDNIMISVKLVGSFTHALFKLNVGDEIEVLGPLGLPYIRDESIDSDIVMIAGGSGVVPYRSLIKYYIDNNKNNRMFLLLSNKTMGDICYREQLMEYCAHKDNLMVTHFITNQDIDINDFIVKGIINEKYFMRMFSNPAEKIYFICGPKGLISLSVQILVGMGVPMDKIKTESWG
ncbi:MAG: ferredoxin--NADP reductase [Candidatus Woesearchaeota archaeon]